MGKIHLLVVPCRLFLPLLISPRLPGCTRRIFGLSFLSEHHAAPSSPVLLWLPFLHLPSHLEQSSGNIYLFKYWRIVYVLVTLSSFCVIIASSTVMTLFKKQLFLSMEYSPVSQFCGLIESGHWSGSVELPSHGI